MHIVECWLTLNNIQLRCLQKLLATACEDLVGQPRDVSAMLAVTAKTRNSISWAHILQQTWCTNVYQLNSPCSYRLAMNFLCLFPSIPVTIIPCGRYASKETRLGIGRCIILNTFASFYFKALDQQCKSRASLFFAEVSCGNQIQALWLDLRHGLVFFGMSWPCSFENRTVTLAIKRLTYDFAM